MVKIYCLAGIIRVTLHITNVLVIIVYHGDMFVMEIGNAQEELKNGIVIKYLAPVSFIARTPQSVFIQVVFVITITLLTAHMETTSISVISPFRTVYLNVFVRFSQHMCNLNGKLENMIDRNIRHLHTDNL